MIVVNPTRPFRMLITDDDSGFRETLRGIFEPRFQMLEAESGEEAIEIAESEPLDIALLDMHMHVLTGLETLQLLRSVQLLLPCILITADATDDLRRQATQADAYSVLRKPIRKMELVLTVSRALELPADDDWPNLLN
jgi:CheY-like chemotaxis protein